MAHDDTPPKNRIIFVSTLASALTLVVLAPLFVSYFTSFITSEYAAKVLAVPATAYAATKAEQLEALERGPVPIARAVELLATRGRDADPRLEPVQSDDVSAVEGWNLAKNTAAAAAASQAVERRRAAEEAARAAAEGGAPTAEGAPAAPAAGTASAAGPARPGPESAP